MTIIVNQCEHPVRTFAIHFDSIFKQIQRGHTKHRKGILEKPQRNAV